MHLLDVIRVGGRTVTSEGGGKASGWDENKEPHRLGMLVIGHAAAIGSCLGSRIGHFFAWRPPLRSFPVIQQQQQPRGES